MLHTARSYTCPAASFNAAACDAYLAGPYSSGGQGRFAVEDYEVFVISSNTIASQIFADDTEVATVKQWVAKDLPAFKGTPQKENPRLSHDGARALLAR